MTNEEKWEVIDKAIDNASKVFGCDPAYFGKEGDEKIERQLEKLGYNPMDFRK